MIKKNSGQEFKEEVFKPEAPPQKKEKVKIEEELEKKEKSIPVPEKTLLQHLREEIELMKVEESLAKKAEKKAQEIKFLGQKEKIEHLLKLATQKGVIFAVQVAKRMNDPYILDIFHDILAREGYYKQFKLR